jgi:ABC-type branched-subunit amino acid transport system substrate-binding protein
MTRYARRTAATAALLVFTATACTGAKLPRATGNGTDALAQGSLAPGAGASASAAAAPASASANGGKPGTGKPGAPGRPGGNTGGPMGPVVTTGPAIPPHDIAGDLQLFSGALNTRGITSDEIKICAHAALTYANAFNTKPSDFNVFWTDLNSKGGIYGRKVSSTYQDDAYEPAQAITAAQNCADSGPFAILGGIGFDQIPGVREWAEQHKELYIHHDATEKGLAGKQYSFTPIPTVEQLGRMFAQLAASKFKGKRIGIIYRDSPYWAPGYEAFKAAAKQYGLTLGKAIGVQNKQAHYGQEMLALQQDHVDVVWAWENALAATEIINQAPPGFRPAYMIFPFNLTTQTIADKGLDIYGIASWPAYSYHDYSGPFASYAPAIKEFEAQYAKWDPNVDLSGAGGDLLFLNWVGQKALYQVLKDCGAACTRNHFATLLNHYKGTVSPNCYTDYPAHGGHLGSQAVNVFHTYTAPNGNLGWQPIVRCTEHLV